MSFDEIGHARCRLHSARRAWREVVESMAGVEASRLGSCISVRVRVPSATCRCGVWLDFMGRPCFLEALTLVEKQGHGQRVCITGARGSGKGYLLGALAAFMAYSRPDAAVVHIEGGFFAETPLHTLMLSMFVAFGRDEAAVDELAAIETWDDVVHWMRQRRETFYFLINTADVFAAMWPWEERCKTAISLLTSAADAVGAIVIYASAVPLCLGAPPSSVFVVPAFDGVEVRSFLKKKGWEVTDCESFWSCTGGVPALMRSYFEGDHAPFSRYYRRVEDFFGKMRETVEWELVFKALSGCSMTPSASSGTGSESAVLKVMGKTGCVLFRNQQGVGDCLVDALKPQLSFQSLQMTSLDLLQVLQIWLMPVLDKTASGSSKTWNSLMAIATVIALRKQVHLNGISETMNVDMVSLRTHWQSLYVSEKEMLLGLESMRWPQVVVTMHEKAFVFGLEQDFESYHESRAAFMDLVMRGNRLLGYPYHVYFIWIGFEDRLGGATAVCKYNEYTDVFMKYGAFDSLLAPLDTVWRPAQTSLCHYILGGRYKACRLHARHDKLFCHLHSCMTMEFKD